MKKLTSLALALIVPVATIGLSSVSAEELEEMPGVDEAAWE